MDKILDVHLSAYLHIIVEITYLLNNIIKNLSYPHSYILYITHYIEIKNQMHNWDSFRLTCL